MFCFFLPKVEINEENPPIISIMLNNFLKMVGFIVPAIHDPKIENKTPETLKIKVVFHTIFLL